MFCINMQVSNSYSQQNFTSKLYPVKPFKVKTNAGKLFVKEVTQKEINQKGFINNLAKIFAKNIASNTEDPSWKIVLSSKKEGKLALENFENYLRKRLNINDDTLTLLVAYDKNKKMQGACLSFGFDDMPICEKSVCYIELLGINKKYRGTGVGKLIVEKTMESAKNIFTDVYLAGENLALGFYKKLGFKKLNPADKAQKAVIDFISIDREDYPEFISLLTKPLQPNKPRWYTVAARELNLNKFQELLRMYLEGTL